MKPMLGLGAPDPAAIAEAAEDFHRFARVLDEHLAGRTWRVAGRLSYADFRVATALPFAEEAAFAFGKICHIHSWHARLMKLPAWSRPFSGLT